MGVDAFTAGFKPSEDSTRAPALMAIDPRNRFRRVVLMFESFDTRKPNS
jgi:hypothetical protein